MAFQHYHMVAQYWEIGERGNVVINKLRRVIDVEWYVYYYVVGAGRMALNFCSSYFAWFAANEVTGNYHGYNKQCLLIICGVPGGLRKTYNSNISAKAYAIYMN